MTNPNTLPQPAEEEPRQHKEVGAAAIHLADQAGATNNSAAADQVPGRPNERWAISGPHYGWLGFDSKTGEPKVG